MTTNDDAGGGTSIVRVGAAAVNSGARATPRATGGAETLAGHVPRNGGYIQPMIRNDKELIVVGDRVLVKVEEGEERTSVGLYLPSTAIEGQAVQGGTIMATGPGQPMPSFDAASGEEPWKETAREMRFVPMQARRGDFALFFRKAAVEITFEGERFLVVPQAAILALVRE